MPAPDAVRFEPIKPLIGATVAVDRERICEPATVTAIRAALEDRGVLVFPQLALSDAEQLAFTDAFGQRLDYTRGMSNRDGEAEESDVYKIALGKDSPIAPEFVLATWFWHMDGVTIDQPLPKATMLSARTLSPTGGQTEFASTFAAWSQMPAARQRELADWQVIHSTQAAVRMIRKEPMAPTGMPMARMLLPLVWTQADGRQSLVLGSHADEIVGMSYAASRSTLTRLIEWAAQPDFSYTHDWQVGDFVIWNNCGVMHRVVPYPEDSGRMMRRTSISGDIRLGRPLDEADPA